MNPIEVNINEIKLNPDNPRSIRDKRFDSLVKSVKSFPEMLRIRPIVVDADNVVLGGNMRLRACQKAGMKTVWVIRADSLTEDQKREFIIKDNVGFGDWDMDLLANEWDQGELVEWGMELVGFDVSADEFGEDFSLKDGDKEPFQQMTFTLADEQAEVIKAAIADIKQTEEYKYSETFGNENSNGNALYLIVASWAGQRK